MNHASTAVEYMHVARGIAHADSGMLSRHGSAADAAKFTDEGIAEHSGGQSRGVVLLQRDDVSDHSRQPNTKCASAAPSKCLSKPFLRCLQTD